MRSEKRERERRERERVVQRGELRRVRSDDDPLTRFISAVKSGSALMRSFMRDSGDEMSTRFMKAALECELRNSVYSGSGK